VSEPVTIVGEAVLRDYPLRLWARQQEHFESLLREFQLLLVGESSWESTHAAPRQLVELADMFTARFGSMIDAINAARQAALDEGKDRMDSRIPLVEGTPALLGQVDQVMRAVDEYCRAGDLLVLPRSEELIALSGWANSEIVTQYEGGEPTPWPGPF
jgi:hypothetical protein